VAAAVAASVAADDLFEPHLSGRVGTVAETLRHCPSDSLCWPDRSVAGADEMAAENRSTDGAVSIGPEKTKPASSSSGLTRESNRHPSMVNYR